MLLYSGMTNIASFVAMALFLSFLTEIIISRVVRQSGPSFQIRRQVLQLEKIDPKYRMKFMKYKIQDTQIKKILNAKILNTKNKYEIQFSKYKKRLHLLKLQNNKMCSFTTGGQSLRCR